MAQTPFKASPLFNQSPSAFPHSGPMFRGEMGAVRLQAQRDQLKALWGRPAGLGKYEISNEELATRNLQSDDIIALYDGRELVFPSNKVTAAFLNGAAGFLTSVVAPVLETSEMSFKIKFDEINQTPYTTVTAGGIPREQSHRKKEWTDKVKKKKLMGRIENSVLLDPNFGEQAWLRELAALASNASFTLNLEVAYQLVEISYRNQVLNRSKNIPMDTSKVLLAEQKSFGVAAYDADVFYQLILKMYDDINDMDLILLPQGSIQMITNIRGESRSMEAQKLIVNPQTGNVERVIIQGPDSIKTVILGGGKTLSFLEVPNFKINMDDGRTLQPFRTNVTLCQMTPPNPDIKATDDNMLDPRTNDLFMYAQSRTEGDRRRIDHREALKHCWLWDPKTKEPSEHYIRQVIKQNRRLHDVGDNKPVDWKNGAGTIDDETILDYDTPANDSIDNKKTLLDMKGWRDQFGFTTFLPGQDKFVIPKHIGDFHVKTMPHLWIHKIARAIKKKGFQNIDIDCDMMLRDLMDLVDSINSEPVDDHYLRALIEKNYPKMYNENNNSIRTSKTPASRKHIFPGTTVLNEWVPNRYGSLDLPDRDGRMPQTFPPGFSNGVGLQTLAKEADKDTSGWKEAGARAKRAIAFLSHMETLIKDYVGHKSDIINPEYTYPWIHKDSGITVLLDSLLHNHTPMFLAVPPPKSESEFVKSTTKQDKDVTGRIRNKFATSSSAIKNMYFELSNETSFNQFKAQYSVESVNQHIAGLLTRNMHAFYYSSTGKWLRTASCLNEEAYYEGFLRVLWFIRFYRSQPDVTKFTSPQKTKLIKDLKLDDGYVTIFDILDTIGNKFVKFVSDACQEKDFKKGTSSDRDALLSNYVIGLGQLMKISTVGTLQTKDERTGVNGTQKIMDVYKMMERLVLPDKHQGKTRKAEVKHELDNILDAAMNHWSTTNDSLYKTKGYKKDTWNRVKFGDDVRKLEKNTRKRIMNQQITTGRSYQEMIDLYDNFWDTWSSFKASSPYNTQGESTDLRLLLTSDPFVQATRIYVNAYNITGTLPGDLQAKANNLASAAQSVIFSIKNIWTDDTVRTERVGDLINRRTTSGKQKVFPAFENINDTHHLRAPLVASVEFIEYFKSKGGMPNALAVPADPSTLYETPIERANAIDRLSQMPSIILTSMKASDFFDSDMKTKLSSFPMGVSFMKSNSEGDSDEEDDDEDEEDYDDNSSIEESYTKGKSMFSSLTGGGGGRRNKKASVAHILHGSTNDYGDMGGPSKYKFNRNNIIKRGDTIEDHYFGPWFSRLEYARGSIGSPCEKLLYMAVLFAPNTLDIHDNIAKIGEKLINLTYWRTAIQHRMNSIIGMKAGSETLITALGHIAINPSMEGGPGYTNVTSEFFHGTIRKNPDNIGMLPYALPYRFVGGMKLDFMSEPGDWLRHNPARKSITVIPTPVSETVYDYPIHALNAPTYFRKDIDNDPHFRKFSSSGFFVTIFGDNILELEKKSGERRDYYDAVPVSLVGHRGPAVYFNPDAKRFDKSIAGTGPRGEIEKNMRGSHLAWNGDDVKFPDRKEDQAYYS